MTEQQALRLGRRIVWVTRAGRRHDAPFPLTASWIQRVSRRVGEPVGRDRAYAIQHALRRAGEIEEAGSYPQRRFGVFTGFRVKLWKPATRTGRTTSSVPERKPATGWWTHPLFGFGQESYPKELPKWLKRWRPRRAP